MGHDEQLARSILEVLDMHGVELAPLGVGFASDAWFVHGGLGWDLADRTLARYLDDRGELDRWRSRIALIALSLGARRWEQDRDQGLEEDAHNEAFLHEALQRT